MITTIPRLVWLKPVVLDHRRVTLTLKTSDLPPNPHKSACLVNFAPSVGAASINALPASNVSLNFEMNAPATIPVSPSQPPNQLKSPKPPKPDGKDLDDLLKNALYPNIELSLLDSDNNEVAQAIIIEHQEEEISFTLHIRHPQPDQTYTACVNMIYHQELLQTLNEPFVLTVPDSDIEYQA